MWTKLPAWTGTIHQGCLNAPAVEEIAPLDTLVAVGFGAALITKDGAIVFSEMHAGDWHTLDAFEAMAAADPDHDWRLVLEAPLRSSVYQRHDTARWVLIESGMGFA